MSNHHPSLVIRSVDLVRKTAWLKALVLLMAFAASSVIHMTLEDVFDHFVGAAMIIPVIAGGLLYGTRTGLLVALLSPPAYFATDLFYGDEFAMEPGPLFGMLMNVPVGAAVGGLHDVSRRRRLESEERARLLVERTRMTEALRHTITSARCVVWHADVRREVGTTYNWNLAVIDEAAALAWLPIQRDAGATFSSNWWNSVQADDRAAMEERAHQALVRGAPGFDQEFRCVLADGSTRWLQEDIHIEKVGVDHWRLVGVCMDATDRKAQEKARAEAERLRGAMLVVRTLEHHLGNELGIAQGYTELLATDPTLPESLRFSAQAALDGVTQATATLARLRAIDRLEPTESAGVAYLDLDASSSASLHPVPTY